MTHLSDLKCKCLSAQWHTPACSRYRENQAGEDFGHGNEVRLWNGLTGVVFVDAEHKCEGDIVPVRYYDKITGLLSDAIRMTRVWALVNNFSME